MNLEVNAQYTNPVTDEEQALIDDFIAKNGVTKVERGVSGLPDPSIKMHWKDQREIMRRVYLRQKKFENAATRRKQPEKAAEPSPEAQILEILQGAEHTLSTNDIVPIVGMHRRTVRKYLRKLIEKGLVEQIGASSTSRYRVAA